MVPRHFRSSTMQLITVIRAFTWTDRDQAGTVCPKGKERPYYRQTPVPWIHRDQKFKLQGERIAVGQRLESAPLDRPVAHLDGPLVGLAQVDARASAGTRAG